ncbi:auxin-responsive protein IAA33-like [Hibiscus syriacus]|uniref:auxin-responsive protein IAA33-like n=1 Tax=Hibiscus syriacus TaxID=106335 RepID=UPI001922D4A9|nr:auxin-responsive protein IAA33-like [Hibiscus syriacus]
MNTFESQTQNPSRFLSSSSLNPRRFTCLDDDDLVSKVVPLVTVVLEGRSICQRISLHSHASYQSLAKALRQMFVDENGTVTSENDLDLSNAVPGHLVAYEDMENDLLLAGDLNWKDFVRVAWRIRILPAKGNARKEEEEYS